MAIFIGMKFLIGFFILLFVISSCTTRDMHSIATEPVNEGVAAWPSIPIDPVSVVEQMEPANPVVAMTHDPRIVGMWYFTLMTSTESGATKLSIFCRANGLKTYVINSDNTRLFRVIALPGFIDRKNETSASTRSKIRAIGRKFADTADGRGNDLRDTYLSLKKHPKNHYYTADPTPLQIPEP